MRICVIGLGRMGRGIAVNLSRKGHEVLGFDIDPNAAGRLSGSNVVVVNDMVKCTDGVDYVIIAVPTGRESISVISNIANAAKGIILDTTTMSLSELSNVLKIIEEKRLRYLSVRLEKGPREAERGELVLYVGGDEGLFKEANSILSQIGTPIYVGNHEQATALKLISNVILTANTVVLAEVSVLIRKLGMDPDTVVKALSMGGSDSAQLRTRLPWMLKGNYGESFSLRLARDVIDKALEYAQSIGIQLPMTTLIDELLRIAETTGYGSKDFSEIAEVLKVNEKK
ncbi:NAD(P)-dependent oxidoreductase [Caldivirga maquilingensis]|uniref:6-phosphogluconate dehydrogenase NAD-binding n=1 Tax=Caldivirga maquilingensis (strain ATCC 700844 / DSM 13496 / JCM 10307 / IC-167) TaxID=397948 RepID=A8MD56_CALMQ|nr:NAD(P)-dependent oxidoreductase [Caldivirga maquilingensis]ABW01712.1 6-phosphogluconate dehydrogenase NAD-binding [Caldivirga maquilingensis IC-167]